MITGGCLCGQVRYKYSGVLSEIVACHCQQCKRAQGGAFALNSPIELALFEFESGEELLKDYRHTNVKRRVFCGNCASPLFSQLDHMPHIIRLRLGSLDDVLLPQPSTHIHHDMAVPWCEFDLSQTRHSAAKPKTD